MRPESARLTFRDMLPDDLDDMAALLGDPEVMTYYPRPKTREEAAQWIMWNRGLYRTHGYGLWLLTTPDGSFVGDCGLTPQVVDGVTERSRLTREPGCRPPSVVRSSVSGETSAANESSVTSRAVRHTPLTAIESPFATSDVARLADTTSLTPAVATFIDAIVPSSSMSPVNTFFSCQLSVVGFQFLVFSYYL